MGKINILEPKVFNMIAAGEVVERPASVVKELVENSIDAGATAVDVYIEDGGIRRIQVSDNGLGILPEDIKTAFMPHATSKLKDIDDLDTLSSLGFRGEALASIASVSEITMISRAKGSEIASKIVLSGGKIIFEGGDSRVEGTVIDVENLFFNTPARAKFLKTPQAEQRAILSVIEKLALSNPEITLTLSNQDVALFSQEGGSLSDSICAVLGVETMEKMLEIDYYSGNIHVGGFTSRTDYTRPTRSEQTFIVNGRAVESKDISFAVDRAYEGRLVKRNYPACVLNILIPFEDVDINVHPRKSEVRFRDKNAVFSAVYRAISNAVDSFDVLSGALFKPQNNQKSASDSDKTGENPTNLQNNTDKIKTEREYAQDRIDTSSLYNITDHSRRNMLPYGKIPTFTSNDGKLHESYDFKSVDGAKQASNHSPEENSVSFKPIEAQNNNQNFVDDSHNKDNGNIDNGANLANSFTTKIRRLFDGTIVGQLFDTYIIVERDNIAYIIDQHAAHERILYEKLLVRLDEKDLVVQSLLIPYKFRLSRTEEEYFEKILPSLKNYGFDIEKKFDDYFIYTVPELIAGMDFKKFLGEVFKNMLSDNEIKLKDVLKDMLCKQACKAAIKGGDSLSREQIEDVLDTLVGADGRLPDKCPHGRPAVVALAISDIEKMFKRIV